MSRPIEPVLNDAQVDAALAGGGLSGPQLDNVWARVSADLQGNKVTAGAPGTVPSGRSKPRWLAGLMGGLGVAGACAVLFVAVGPQTSTVDATGFVVRGDDASGAAVLESTCGAPDAACTVGEPVYLRLRMGAQPGTARVMLESTAGRTVLMGPLPVAAATLLPLDVKIRPERDDVDVPIRIVTEVVLGDGTRRENVLTLQVKP